MIIDKSKNYDFGGYFFKSFSNITPKESESILIWRNYQYNRKYMYNTEEISQEDHNRFIASLPSLTDRCYWLVSKNDEPVGVINLSGIDYEMNKAELGYYMVPFQQKVGNGLEFVFTTLYFLYDQIGCTQLFGSVHKENINALILDSYLGFELDKNDLAKLDKITFINWVQDGKSFLESVPEKNDFRKLVAYMKANKILIDNIKNNAPLF